MLLVGPFYVAWPPAQVIVVFHGLPLAALVIMALWIIRLPIGVGAWKKY